MRKTCSLILLIGLLAAATTAPAVADDHPPLAKPPFGAEQANKFPGQLPVVEINVIFTDIADPFGLILFFGRNKNEALA